MPLITLLSDWGQDDPYLAEVKLRICSLMPDCRILDISHGLERDDLVGAAFMMHSLYPAMPEGAIHILGMQDIAGSNLPHLAVRFGSQVFLAADNGFFEYFGWISGRKPDEIYEIDVCQEPDFEGLDVYTFPSRDLFPKVAAMLARGEGLERLGHQVSLSLKAMPSPKKSVRVLKDGYGKPIGCWMTGEILYIDRFGNACTNIRKSDYEEWIREYPFNCIYIGGKKLKKPPVKAYQDVSEGSLLGLFLKNGFLEISICGGHAANLLGLRRGSAVSVAFGQEAD